MHDHSWALAGTTVLEVTHASGRYIVKAGDEHDHHIAREIRAHREWLAPWTSRRRAPSLIHADAEAKILVTRFLDGCLVQGTEAEWHADTYRQAGQLLALLHGQLDKQDAEFEVAANDRAIRWLDAAHRIAAESVEWLRHEIRSWPTPPVTVVPTHGDWQPRGLGL